jgi:hypothetical protein
MQVPGEIIEQWVLHVDWKERRNKMLYEQFCSLQELREKRKQDLDDRHDRLALGLEDTIESMLHDHHSRDSDYCLDPRDIGALAKAVSTLQGVRRTAHGKAGQVQEHHKKITFESSDGFDNMTSMIAGFFGVQKELPDNQPEQLAITDAKDVEFEVLDSSQEEDPAVPEG